MPPQKSSSGVWLVVKLLENMIVIISPLLHSSTQDLPVTTLPALPLATSFFDSADTQQSAHAFLARYLHLFDTDRTALLDVYHARSQFSYTVSAQIPAVLVVAGNKENSETRQLSRAVDDSLTSAGTTTSTSTPATSTSWPAHDRNLRRLRDPAAKIQRLFSTPINILHQLVHMPATRHAPLDACIVDAWQVPGASPPQLIINVHGVFEEVAASSTPGAVSTTATSRPPLVRHYDRTFVLVPAAADSKAVRAGWPVELLNDQWSVRAVFADPKAALLANGDAPAGKPSTSHIRRLEKNVRGVSVLEHVVRGCLVNVGAVVTQVPKAVPASDAAAVSALAQQQQQEQHQQDMLVAQLCQATGMNPAFSRLCLAEQSWDVARALEVFRQAKV